MAGASPPAQRWATGSMATARPSMSKSPPANCKRARPGKAPASARPSVSTTWSAGSTATAYRPTAPWWCRSNPWPGASPRSAGIRQRSTATTCGSCSAPSRGRMRAMASARRWCCARGQAAASGASSSARARISCASNPTNGMTWHANWRPRMHDSPTLSPPPARTLAMGESEAVGGRPTVRAPFSLGLMKAAANHPELVLLTADLGKYTDVADFRARYGERFFNVGMAEQALVGAAAGLSKVGKVAYCTTYGTFATRRAYDFLAIACAHSHENVKMFAGNPGLTTGYGGTHQATEDLALMRSIPNMSVIDPCDATEMAQIAELAADLPGTLYCRLLRADVAQVFDPATHRWRPGTGHVIGSSAADTDVGLVSTGLMTGRAIDAAGHLRQRGASAPAFHRPGPPPRGAGPRGRRGASAWVFHSASLKPFDSQGLLAFAQSARRLVVLENHVASGGLATLGIKALQEAGLGGGGRGGLGNWAGGVGVWKSCGAGGGRATLVIKALQEAGLARRLLKIALPDQFIECGSLAYLQERYGLTTERICARVGAWLQ